MIQELQSTCDEVRAHADAIAADVTVARKVQAALGAAIERHLLVAERTLSSVARRALLREHRRIAQLLRALGLALDDGDARAIALRARRLAECVAGHSERERDYIRSAAERGSES